jgi:hypothetical protein
MRGGLGESPTLLVTTREFIVGRYLFSMRRFVFDDEFTLLEPVNIDQPTQPIRVVPRD